MSSRETHLGVPGASREAITRRTRESVDDDHLASDGCGLSRLAQNFFRFFVFIFWPRSGRAGNDGKLGRSVRVRDISCQTFVICYGFDARYSGNYWFFQILTNGLSVAL